MYEYEALELCVANDIINVNYNMKSYFIFELIHGRM